MRGVCVVSVCVCEASVCECGECVCGVSVCARASMWILKSIPTYPLSSSTALSHCIPVVAAVTGRGNVAWEHAH